MDKTELDLTIAMVLLIFGITMLVVFVIIPALWDWRERRERRRRREQEDWERIRERLRRPPSPIPERPKPTPSLQLEELTLIIREPLPQAGYRQMLGTRLTPETEWVLPVAKVQLNQRELTGRILPTTFRIFNHANRPVYESTVSYVLKPGMNIIFPKNQVFPIRGRRDVRTGVKWRCELTISSKFISRVVLTIRKDILSELQGRRLTSSDGEFSREAREALGEMEEAPELKDLIDEEIQ